MNRIQREVIEYYESLIEDEKENYESELEYYSNIIESWKTKPLTMWFNSYGKYIFSRRANRAFVMDISPKNMATWFDEYQFYGYFKPKF